MTDRSQRPLALVTGASSGIGYCLAHIAARQGYDLIVAADTPLADAVSDFESLGARVQPLEVELASREGVDRLLEAAAGRSIDVAIANAGHGLGGAFLDQDFRQVQHVVDTNITGTIYFLQRVARRMKAQGSGRILVTGSIAGFQPGAFQAVYNGSKAFIDSFVAALRNEMKDIRGVSITCLMPGPTDTEFFARADMLDTRVGSDVKAMMDPAEVAEIGFRAMLAGEADVIAGLKNKVQVALSRILPTQLVAQQHRRLAEPGVAQHRHGRGTDPSEATWKQAALRGALTGSVASALSMAALAWRGRHDVGSATAGLNAPSHWLFGDRALRQNRPSWCYTAAGMTIHHLSALLWGVLYEKWVARGRRQSPVPVQLGRAVAATAAAAVVDLALTPKRFTPGFERRLSTRSLVMVYGAFALGIAAGSYVARR